MIGLKMMTSQTVSAVRKSLFWLMLLAALSWALVLFSSVLTPFVAGAVIAYFFDPLVVLLERHGMKRLHSTSLILAIFVCLFVIVILAFVPPLIRDLAALITNAPSYADKVQKLAIDTVSPLLGQWGITIDLASLKASTDTLVGQGSTWLLTVMQSVWTGGQVVVSTISLLVISPIVAFYLLADWNRILATLEAWVPPVHRDTTLGVFRDMDRALGGFIRGQAIVCAIMAGWYGLSLSVIGLNSGLVLGVVTGMMTVVPYIGSLTGFAVALAIALAQFWPTSTPIFLLVGAFGLGQFFENYVLAPKLVGGAVGLHPVWLMFALVAFGSLFGFVGVLIAVPLAAVVGVLIRFGLSCYLQSTIYLGEA